MGDTLVMSMGDQSQVPNSHLKNQTFPNKSLYPSDSNLANGGAWRTSGSANDGDDDLVTLSFGPGIETTYKITPGGTNDPNGTVTQITILTTVMEIMIKFMLSLPFPPTTTLMTLCLPYRSKRVRLALSTKPMVHLVRVKRNNIQDVELLFHPSPIPDKTSPKTLHKIFFRSTKMVLTLWKMQALQHLLTLKP